MHDLVGTNVKLMHIDTGDAKPVRKRPYRQCPETQRQMERDCASMAASHVSARCQFLLVSAGFCTVLLMSVILKLTCSD